MDSSALRKLLLVMALACAIPSAIRADKGATPNGEVLSITIGKGLDGVENHRFALIAVQIGDVIYTGDAGRIHHPLDDYTHGFTAGDHVLTEVRGEELTLKKPGGKELKTKIIKKVRAE
jgi:hypothetical protein